MLSVTRTKCANRLSHLPTGRQVNKKHWNTIIVDGSIPSKQLKEWIDDSYNLVAGKKKKIIS